MRSTHGGGGGGGGGHAWKQSTAANGHMLSLKSTLTMSYVHSEFGRDCSKKEETRLLLWLPEGNVGISIVMANKEQRWHIRGEC